MRTVDISQFIERVFQVEMLIVILILLLLGMLIVLFLIVMIVWIILRQHQNTLPFLILLPLFFPFHILHVDDFLNFFNLRIRIYFMIQKSNNIV